MTSQSVLRLCERGGFRFYSSDALFRKIDTRSRLREIRLEVKRVTDAARAKPQPGQGDG